jgi:hypothetical protein
MRTVIAIVCFVLSIIVFLYGVVTEYRQSHATGPIAIVPTLPWAVEGAIFIVMGLFWLPTPIPWWVYLLAFFSSAITFGYLIGSVTQGRKTRK